MYKTALSIVKTLQKANKEAYFAGGCVRDVLLDKEPKDYDIVTNAKPEEIEKILAHTIPIGKQFGVILAVENGHNFEVATFRSDSGYSDGRRPDAVIFTNAEEDAKRRDFTINGMFFDPIQKKVYDYVGGQKDLKEKLIRFIGIPHERISEDHLRILRAVRFKNTLNFQYHPDTYRAIVDNVNLADKVSAERIRDELNKIMLSNNNVEAINDMEDTGLLKEILPEAQEMMGVAQPAQYHEEGDCYKHTLLALQSLPKTVNLKERWAVFLHDIGKPAVFKIAERIRFDHHVEYSEKIAKQILERLKFPRIFIDHVCWLVEHHMMINNLVEMETARKRHWFLKPGFLELMTVFKADIEGTIPIDSSLYKKLERMYKYAMKKIPKEPPKLLSGEEIMKMLKLEPGKKVGEILEKIREEQLKGKIKTREEAERWVTNSKFQVPNLSADRQDPKQIRNSNN